MTYLVRISFDTGHVPINFGRVPISFDTDRVAHDSFVAQWSGEVTPRKTRRPRIDMEDIQATSRPGPTLKRFKLIMRDRNLMGDSGSSGALGVLPWFRRLFDRHNLAPQVPLRRFARLFE